MEKGISRRRVHLLGVTALAGLAAGRAEAQSCAPQPDGSYLCTGTITTFQFIPAPAGGAVAVRTAPDLTMDVEDNDALLVRGPTTIEDRNAARISGAANGITVQSVGAGAIDIATGGIVVGRGTRGGQGGYGIRVDTGTQASGNIAIGIARGGSVSGSTSAIAVNGGGAGAIGITLNGDASRTRAAGAGLPAVVDVRSIVGDPVTLAINGNVTDQADSLAYGVAAVSAVSDRSKGNVTVTVDGTIRAGGGVALQGTGTVAVTVNGRVTATGGSGVSGIFARVGFGATGPTANTRALVSIGSAGTVDGGILVDTEQAAGMDRVTGNLISNAGTVNGGIRVVGGVTRIVNTGTITADPLTRRAIDLSTPGSAIELSGGAVTGDVSFGDGMTLLWNGGTLSGGIGKTSAGAAATATLVGRTQEQTATLRILQASFQDTLNLTGTLIRGGSLGTSVA